MVWFFIIAPFIRLIRVSRQWQNTFKQARNQQQQRQQQHQQQQQRRRSGTQHPGKKIDPSVGEYVEFTETTTPQTDTDAAPRTAHTPVEQQITDVTWEDLPAK